MKNYKGQLKEYERSLRMGEKCSSTIKQYMHHVGEFVEFLDGAAITKADVINYKECARKSRKAESVNNRLAAVNGFLKFVEKENCRVKNLRVQKNLFAREEKELTRKEYQRLLEAAGDSKISYIMQTIVATGIRISELQYITVDAVLTGETVVDNKNKIRRIFLPKKLCWILKQYMKNAGVTAGSLFVTRNGNPLDRSYVWKLMKKLCVKAGVAPEKVFPHNLRHLFARTFYSMEKDIVRLADLLGHSNIQTTRIYTIERGESHRRGLERVQAALSF